MLSFYCDTCNGNKKMNNPENISRKHFTVFNINPWIPFSRWGMILFVSENIAENVLFFKVSFDDTYGSSSIRSNK